MNLTKIVPSKNYYYKVLGCENDKGSLVQTRVYWENHTLLMPLNRKDTETMMIRQATQLFVEGGYPKA